MTQQVMLKCNCDEAIVRVTQAFADSGLQVLRSFDLRAAMSSATRVDNPDDRLAGQMIDWQAALAIPTGCACPQHGTDRCDCQMVVMLVYGAANSPATLVAHGHDGCTWMSLVDSPEQRPDPDLMATIVQRLHSVVASQIYPHEVMVHA